MERFGNERQSKKNPGLSRVFPCEFKPMRSVLSVFTVVKVFRKRRTHHVPSGEMRGAWLM